MRDTFADLDADEIRRDEMHLTARRAVAAAMFDLPAPMDTPLQRDAARFAEREWRRRLIEEMRDRVRH